MKFWAIFGFELGYQARRASTWLYFAVLLALTLYVTRELSGDYARSDHSFSNAPFYIAVMSLVFGTMGLLIGASLAGDAAARDAETRLDPLVYTAPVTKLAYLGGRFFAAFAVYGVILLAVPLGLLLAEWLGNPALLGPFRPAAYVVPYLFLLLPNAFVATAVMFSMAALSRRATLSYLGGVVFVAACAFNWSWVATAWGQWELAKLLDPLGANVLREGLMVWTPAERSTRLIGLHGTLLANRVLWIAIALGVLALTHYRFRFAHHTPGASRYRMSRRGDADTCEQRIKQINVPSVRRTFGFRTHTRQMLVVARESFGAIVRGWGWLILAATAAFLMFSATPIAHMGVPMFATAERVLGFLAAPLTRTPEINWIIVPLLIIFYAGELVWRERDAHSSQITDAMPAPEWVLFAGKFVGLGLMLVALEALMMAAGMLTQMLLGYYDLEVKLYAQSLFGLQLVDYVLFALLALVVHTLVNHKYVGHLAVVLAYALMASGPALGLEHNLLIYGSDPGWMYSDMRGFDPFIEAWLWFKAYWAAWAVLLAVAGTLLWVRGTETTFRSRLVLARRRLSRRAVGMAAATAALVLTLGAFIFYNTNILNAHETASVGQARRAEYERRYGQYKRIPQPQLTSTKLRVEIYPELREVEIRGTYALVNISAAAIDSIHLATRSAVTTTAVRFDRPAKPVVSDAELGHWIYVLETPLHPGESLRLDFEVQFKPRGFPNRGIDASVAANGTYFTNQEWLPGIGYDAERELGRAGERRAYGLDARAALPPLDDATARGDTLRSARVAFDAIVGTKKGQAAVAPGRLRRTWTEKGRSYFHYVTDAPIRNDYAFFSAAYAVHEGRWNDVSIQIFHHPTHAWNVKRMVRSVQASLDYYTQQFGPYPHGQVRFVEHPGDGLGAHAAPVNVSYIEGFSLLDPDKDPRDIDLLFAVVAHEVAHQWWGGRLTPARVEGASVLTESMAWYSALEVVERTFGREHLQRLLGMMREEYVTPRTRANVPLLRARDWFDAYRKGPFAMYAVREYVGAEPVNAAVRRLFEKHGSGSPPLPTSLDLYRELQTVTPESLRPLLADLFERNTFWELEAERAIATQTGAGAWQVSLDVRARKVVVDENNVETERPMDDLIEVGVFAGADAGGLGETLYLQRHRVRSGAQRITVTVPRQPARAGVDPRRLLFDVEGEDHVREIGR
jgi:ABC-2 type transport system permease protein